MSKTNKTQSINSESYTKLFNTLTTSKKTALLDVLLKSYKEELPKEDAAFFNTFDASNNETLPFKSAKDLRKAEFPISHF